MKKIMLVVLIVLLMASVFAMPVLADDDDSRHACEGLRNAVIHTKGGPAETTVYGIYLEHCSAGGVEQQ